MHHSNFHYQHLPFIPWSQFLSVNLKKTLKLTDIYLYTLIPISIRHFRYLFARPLFWTSPGFSSFITPFISTFDVFYYWRKVWLRWVHLRYSCHFIQFELRYYQSSLVDDYKLPAGLIYGIVVRVVCHGDTSINKSCTAIQP